MEHLDGTVAEHGRLKDLVDLLLFISTDVKGHSEHMYKHGVSPLHFSD